MAPGKADGRIRERDDCGKKGRAGIFFMSLVVFITDYNFFKARIIRQII